MKTLGYVVLIVVLVALAVGGYMAFKKGQENAGTQMEEEMVAPEEQGDEPEAAPTEGETDQMGTEGTATEGQ